MNNHTKVMDRILSELFANGGPQLASTPVRNQPVFVLNPRRTNVLEDEQRRLIRTW